MYRTPHPSITKTVFDIPVRSTRKNDPRPKHSREKIHLNFLEKSYVLYKSINYSEPRREQCSQFLQSVSVTLWMTLLTLWVLYAEDIKVIFYDKDSDPVFEVFSLVSIFFFLAEWLLSTWAVPGYSLSFFFWLDMIAILSLITDIATVSDALSLSQDSDGGVDPTSTRAGRAARVGTRAGKVVRIVRLARIGKFAKQLFAYWKLRSKDIEESEETQLIIMDECDNEFVDAMKPSNLGSRLSQLITKRVILGVLGMVFVVPQMLSASDDELYPLRKVVGQLDHMHTLAADGTITASEYDTYVEWWQTDYKYGISKKKLVYLSMGDTTLFENSRAVRKLRTDEVEVYGCGQVLAAFSVEIVKIEDALKNVGLTTFLVFMLMTMALTFGADTETYVIAPVTKMVDSVKMLTEHPMVRQKLGKAHDDLEMSMLCGTVKRIGNLLQLGYGHAGAEVIRSSLSANLRANIGGRHMNAIFAFCDIRNFTDTTECLQQSVMNYVNEIAAIVHATMVNFKASPNKNIGDAFLLVWALPDDCSLPRLQTDTSHPPHGVYRLVQERTDSALIALIKVVLAIHRANNDSFLKYRRHEQVRARMGDGWKVTLGWGLHVGWAIEGALGSEYKIDASYLSPNVNLAEDLEGATKFYGVPFLLSQMMYDTLSPVAQSVCRKIDRVQIAGIGEPFFIYSVDIWQCANEKINREQHEIVGYRRETMHKFEYLTESEQRFFDDPELNALEYGYPALFRQLWDEGLNSYFLGHWKSAQGFFEECLRLLPSDGPTKALLKFMARTDFVEPHTWSGFRIC